MNSDSCFEPAGWNPFDEQPTQALQQQPTRVISRGNALQVPDFGDNISFDSDIDQFLNLDNLANRYYYQQSPQNGPLDQYLQEMKELQFQPLPEFVAQLPQRPEWEQNLQEVILDKKIFNNMPGFLISGVQSLRRYFQSHVLSTSNLKIVKKVGKCFEKLINQILMRLSSKTGNREQLRMVFNDVDEKFNQIIRRKINSNRLIKKYFELLNQFGVEVMNEAKKQLREAVISCMTKDWMGDHAENRRFSRNNVEQKKEVFYKYMVCFTQELYECEVQPLINKGRYLSINSYRTN